MSKIVQWQTVDWSAVAFCGIWSRSTLFAKAYLSQYVGLIYNIGFYKETLEYQIMSHLYTCPDYAHN